MLVVSLLECSFCQSDVDFSCGVVFCGDAGFAD